MKERTKSLVLLLAALGGCTLSWLANACGESFAERSRALSRIDLDRADARSEGGRLSAETDVNPSRVVVLSPAAMEIVFSLGAGDRVVGGSRFTVFPPEAKKLPDIGGIADLNLERLSALEPDLVVIQGESERLKRFCDQRGVQLLVLKIERISDLLAACKDMGVELGVAKRGEDLARRIESELAEVKARVSGLSTVNCFVSVDRRPGAMAGLLTAGSGTFLTEVIEVAGGRNVFGDVDILYPMVSKESLVARAPQAILELKPGDGVHDEERSALQADWQVLPWLPAVKRGSIFIIDRDNALLPSPRIGALARVFAEVLHPETKDVGG